MCEVPAPIAGNGFPGRIPGVPVTLDRSSSSAVTAQNRPVFQSDNPGNPAIRTRSAIFRDTPSKNGRNRPVAMFRKRVIGGRIGPGLAVFAGSGG
jgi:hypothetical protein